MRAQKLWMGLLLTGVMMTQSPEKARAQTSAPFVASAAHLVNDYLDVKVSLAYPGFEALSVDSLGKEHFPLIPLRPPVKPWPPVEAIRHGARVEYRRPGAAVSEPARWAIEVDEKEISLESRWSADDPPESLVIEMDPVFCHLTLLGMVGQDGSIQLPAIMHLPGEGSFRISATPEGSGPLGYDASRDGTNFVKIIFPAATEKQPLIKYRWELVSIHPANVASDSQARFDGFYRNWLNIFQINPRRGVLSNNSASDSCAFCYYEYADIAAQTPPLAKGLNALDMVRQTLDAILHGALAYGMPGYGDFPDFSADTFPSLLIAANDYVQGSKDNSWLRTNYTGLKAWTDKMLATDHNGDGIVKYSLSGNSGSWPPKMVRRPSNWWDTVGFGYEDAYANALAYRALRGMEQMARQANHLEDETRFRAAADKLHDAYFAAFYDSATGVLAGWRSADGQLHDYFFPYISGIAIHYGLVPKDQANGIMDHLLAKMKEVGYTRFDLGLPGNLIPILKKDYVVSDHRWGGGEKQDGTDGFQIYENGGATACFAYFTLAALYDLGRIEEADKMLFPMLESFASGDFQGRCDNGMTKDWKTWDGTCWGYEGFLVDNYYALLAVIDRTAALHRKSSAQP
jgi:hypothetical protein